MSQYIGDISAYAYAVEKGYTGTEEEFAELMASYAEVGQTAVNAANTAKTKAGEAKASADAAAESKSASAASATRAENKAGEAEQSAGAASEKAQATSIDAETARRMAEQAAASAGTAAGHAANAKSDADAAALSKAGAETAKTDAEAAKNGAVTAKGEAEQAKAEAQKIVDDINAKSEKIDQNATDINELKSGLKIVCDTFPTAIGAGAVAVFNTVGKIPLKDVTIDIDYNPNGVTQTVIKHGGKNVLPFSSGVIEKNDVTFTVNADGSIKFSGKANASFAQTFAEFALDAGDYVVSSIGSDTSESSTGGCTIYVRDQDHSATLASFNLSTFSEVAFTISSNTNIRFYALINSGVTVSGTLFPMICRKILNGGRFKTYRPVTTYTVNWTNTIYGGTYDPTSGVVVSKLASDGSELATPVIHTADSISIETFDGINCIWANTGDVKASSYAFYAEKDNLVTWEKGSVQNSETGTFNQSDSYYHTTNYIPIKFGRLAVNCNPRFVLFYDADKNYTECCENDVDLSKVQKASNAYCRVVVSATNYTGVVVVGDETDTNGQLFASIINRYRYLAFAFGNQGKYGMYILGSNDLHHFNCLNIDHPFMSNINSGVRDPAILFYDGWYWIVYTPANGLAIGPQMGLARTKDFVTWEEFENLVVTPSNGDDLSEGYTWAPDFFKEGDNIYIVVSACTSVDHQETFRHRIMEFDPDTHLVGEAFTTNLAFIDAHIYKENGHYYALGAGGNLWKSDTLLSDAWVALSNTGLSFDHYEAQYAVKLDNGKWRVFAQNVAGAIGNAYYYHQDSMGETFESGFGDRVQLSYDQVTKDACAKKWSITTGYFWHFTIYDRNCWNVNNNNF